MIKRASLTDKVNHLGSLVNSPVNNFSEFIGSAGCGENFQKTSDLTTEVTLSKMDFLGSDLHPLRCSLSLALSICVEESNIAIL